MLKNIINDPTLCEKGEERMNWYRSQMPLMASFKERYRKEKAFSGKSLLICMHCEPKAAVRTEALLEAGVERIVFIGNLGSTKDDIAAYLAAKDRVTVMAKKQDTLEDLREYVRLALEEGPYDLFMDNGAAIMQEYDPDSFSFLGGIEETRSGRLILDEKKIVPDFPLLVIDDSRVKRLIENETGVGQSVVDGLMRQTGMLMGGKKILVIGYGWCGRGISQRLRALGAVTYVYDTDYVAMLKAKVEGHIVGYLEDLLKEVEVVITVTGRFSVLKKEHLKYMKDGCVVANAGHYNMEIDVKGFAEDCLERRQVQEGIEEFRYEDKRIFLLQRGNPLNLSSGAGNPIEIMELGYALQLLSLEEIVKNRELKKGIQDLPENINQEAARLSLHLD